MLLEIINIYKVRAAMSYEHASFIYNQERLLNAGRKAILEYSACKEDAVIWRDSYGLD